MVPLTRIIGGFVVVAAAILAVLVAGHPAVAAPTSAASPIIGGPGGVSAGTSVGTSAGTWDGTSAGTSVGASSCADPCLPSSPTLQLSTSQAVPGETIKVTGDGYAQCTEVDSQVTSVRLLVDGTPVADVTGSGGSFSAAITVPPGAPAGNYTVAAECAARPGILASSDLTVTKPGGGNSVSGPGGGNSNPGQGGGNSNPGQG